MTKPPYHDIGNAIKHAKEKNKEANMFIINRNDKTTPTATPEREEIIPQVTDFGIPSENNEIKIKSYFEDPLHTTNFVNSSISTNSPINPKPEMNISVDKLGNIIYRSQYCNPECLDSKTKRLKNNECPESDCFIINTNGTPSVTSFGEHFTDTTTENFKDDGHMSTGKKNALKIMEWITIILSIVLIILCIVIFYKKK